MTYNTNQAQQKDHDNNIYKLTIKVAMKSIPQQHDYYAGNNQRYEWDNLLYHSLFVAIYHAEKHDDQNNNAHNIQIHSYTSLSALADINSKFEKNFLILTDAYFNCIVSIDESVINKYL